MKRVTLFLVGAAPNKPRILDIIASEKALAPCEASRLLPPPSMRFPDGSTAILPGADDPDMLPFRPDIVLICLDESPPAAQLTEIRKLFPRGVPVPGTVAVVGVSDSLPVEQAMAMRRAAALACEQELGQTTAAVCVGIASGKGAHVLKRALFAAVSRVSDPDLSALPELFVLDAFVSDGETVELSAVVTAGEWRLGDKLCLTDAGEPLEITGLRTSGGPTVSARAGEWVAAAIRIPAPGDIIRQGYGRSPGAQPCLTGSLEQSAIAKAYPTASPEHSAIAKAYPTASPEHSAIAQAYPTFSPEQSAIAQPCLTGSLEQSAIAQALHCEPAGLTEVEIAEAVGLPAEAVAAAIGGEPLASAVRALPNERFVTNAQYLLWTARMQRTLMRYEARNPAKPGIPLAELDKVLAIPAGKPGARSSRFALIMGNWKCMGQIAVDDGFAHRPGFIPTLTARQEKLMQRIEALYQESGIAAPTMEQAAKILQTPLDAVRGVLEIGQTHGRFVQAAEGICYDRATAQHLISLVREECRRQGGISVAELRDLTETNRDAALAALEYLDRCGVTRREENRHVLAETVPSADGASTDAPL